MTNAAVRPTAAGLGARATPGIGADEMLERFLAWAGEIGFELFAAQEEAVLELFAGRHVVLNTPTGSGKSLVAVALHFKAMCEGGRSYYTSPIKALVSEKFFALCEEFGAQNVGMLTGESSINADAPIICCTAEILANLALRLGDQAPIDAVIMDEFHYYADHDRGMAWQIPLLTLRSAQLLLMSATLGDMSVFRREIQAFTGREVTIVSSDQRPVPLDFAYKETFIHETIDELLEQGRAPIYIVAFSQRECAEQAQNLLSTNFCSKDDKRAIADIVGDFHFDTPFGKEVRKLVMHGVGIHHAGLLPKYRLLVEKLAQQGKLRVICGTDTLGVGINIPIRTVLFTKLCKFDGNKVRILSVRDFKQIAGRAGRKGFDDRGSVVCQAPEHVIENKRMELKAEGDPKKKRKLVRKKPPERGYVPWDKSTFEKIIESPPEPLESRFQVTHGMLLNVMERDISHGRRDGGYRRLIEIIGRSYESPRNRSLHRRRAALLFRALMDADIIEKVPVAWARGPAVRIHSELQRDFSLHHTLSLYLVDALYALDPGSPKYALDVVSLVEAILESPQAILIKQVDVAKRDLLGQLKAEGVEYEERMARLDEVTHPQPNAEFVNATFEMFRKSHPWVGREDVRPKSIVRDMYERWATFNEYIALYGLERSEGLVLRYVTEAYKALIQSVADRYKDESVLDVLAYLRTMLARVDSSLVREWEQLVLGAEQGEELSAVPAPPRDPARDPKAFLARIRVELHRLVKALADRDYEEAVACVVQDADDPWTAERFATECRAIEDDMGPIRFDHAARFTDRTLVRQVAPRQWNVRQLLADPETDDVSAVVVAIEGEIDLRSEVDFDAPLVRIREFVR